MQMHECVDIADRHVLDRLLANCSGVVDYYRDRFRLRDFACGLPRSLHIAEVDEYGAQPRGREPRGPARHAQHPNAALLFYEYLLGPEGQQAMVSIDYVPTNTKVPSPLKGVKIIQTDPIRSLDESDKWKKLYEETVLKKAGA